MIDGCLCVSGISAKAKVLLLKPAGDIVGKYLNRICIRDREEPGTEGGQAVALEEGSPGVYIRERGCQSVLE